jgi:hypothetical protein
MRRTWYHLLLGAALMGGATLQPSYGQSFSSYAPVSVDSGLLFEINGTPIDTSTLSLVGVDGTYRVGFAATGAKIVVTFDTGVSGFGGVTAGDKLDITRIAVVDLIDEDGLTATRSGASLFDQSGAATSIAWVLHDPNGAVTGYADDSSGLFASSKSFLAWSDSEGTGGDKPRYGDFGFTGASSLATHPMLMGLDVGGTLEGDATGAFRTGRIYLTHVPGGSHTPEPGTLAMLSGLVVGSGTLVLRRKRRLAA